MAAIARRADARRALRRSACAAMNAFTRSTSAGSTRARAAGPRARRTRAGAPARGRAPRGSSPRTSPAAPSRGRSAARPASRQLAARPRCRRPCAGRRRRRSAVDTSRIVAMRSACVLRPETKPDACTRCQCGVAGEVEAAVARERLPQRAQRRGIAVDDVEDEALEVRRLRDVHRRARRRVRLGRARAAGSGRCGRTRRARRSRWWRASGAGSAAPSRARRGRRRCCRSCPTARRTTTCSSLRARGGEVALEVVDDLRRDARPVDRVHRADAMPRLERGVGVHRLHDVLAVVERALDREVVDVRRPAASTSAPAGTGSCARCGDSMNTCDAALAAHRVLGGASRCRRTSRRGC